MTGAPPTLPAAQAGTFQLGGDLTLNRLGFGAMRITGPGIWGEPADPEAARRLLRRVVELGVNLIDTADSYGPDVSERLIAEALHPYPHGLVIATKGGLTRSGPGGWHRYGHPDHLVRALEGSLRRLKRDCIDLYQLHAIDPNIMLEESVGALARLREQGKIRHVGLSNVSVEQLRRAQRLVPIVSVQNRYSLTDRSHEDVLEVCEREQIAFLPWYPLGSGRLASEGGPLAQVAQRHSASPAQVALAWLLHRSPVILPIPGTSSLLHLEENVASAALRLSSEDLELLARA